MQTSRLEALPTILRKAYPNLIFRELLLVLSAGAVTEFWQAFGATTSLTCALAL